MEAYKIRLKLERDELNDKMSKLFIFVGSTGFAKLSAENKQLLLAQFDAMKLYESILSKRIDLAV